MITSSPLLLANTQRQHRPYQCPLVNREFHRIRSTRNDIMKALTFFFFQLETFPFVTKRQIEKLFYSKGARSIAWATFFFIRQGGSIAVIQFCMHAKRFLFNTRPHADEAYASIQWKITDWAWLCVKTAVITAIDSNFYICFLRLVVAQQSGSSHVVLP